MQIDTETSHQIQKAFPFLEDSGDFYEKFIQSVSIVNAPEKYEVISPGDVCKNLSLILEGTVRVFKIGENGREITLYRIGPGESCILTASCILNHAQSPALAVTETEIKAIMIPASTVRIWMDESSSWRHFIFDLISKRLTDVISVIEEIAFRRMDSRLALWLIENKENTNKLHTTHQHIAEELGTAREVISRILKDFEVRGSIKLARGEIEILNEWVLLQKVDKK